MLRRSLQLLPGIGDKRERMLWRDGIHDWESYLAAPSVRGVSGELKRTHEPVVQQAIAARAGNDLGALAALVPRREHWRFFVSDVRRPGYLDIETTGVDPRSTVTVVGILDGAGGKFHQLVQGRDLDHERLADILGGFDAIVTFNGTGFDVPVLRNHFPKAVPDIPHLDLRGALARLGYRGGLKRIEAELGFARPEDVVGVDGYEAVLLWRRWQLRRDEAALRRLLAYNEEDVVNMEGIAKMVTPALHNGLCSYWGGAYLPVPFPRGRPSRMPEAFASILAAPSQARLV